MLSLGPRPISSPHNWKWIPRWTKFLLPCYLQPPCGTWPASFRAAPCAADLKNNSMHKCFTLLLRFAPPMSRRQVTNRREVLLPFPIPDRHQRAGVFDPSVPPAAAIKAGEPPGAWARLSTHQRAAKQASQMTQAATPVATREFIAGIHILAKLVFRQIRPRDHAGMIGGQSCPNETQHACAPIASPDMALPRRACADVPAAAPAPPIETLFTQLARRRLRSRATEETP